MAAGETVHATCLVLREAGLLIRGGPGSGKTSLALGLLDRAAASGFHAALVGDDRIWLAACNGRLVARGHPAVTGLMEVRGHGIREAAATQDAAVIRLVVDLVGDLPRLPDAAEGTASILGTTLRCLILDRPVLERRLAVRIVLDSLFPQAEGVAARTHPPILSPWTPRSP